MKNNILNGNIIKENIEEEIKLGLKGSIIRPSVAVIQIGNNELNERYLKIKEDACSKVGIFLRQYKYDDNTSELTIINKIKELNNDDYVHGIMIQLPIPSKYNEKRLLNTINNSKDVDGLTDINIGRLISGRKTIVPCTVLAILEIFKEKNIELEGKNVTIIGKGKLVGKPLMYSLLNLGCTVTVCHSKTIDLKSHTKNADIVISAAGYRNLINSEMIKENAIVIDVGCSIYENKICGDVDFESVSKKASLLTPAIGGVGPIGIAMFLKNVIMCYNSKINKK